MTRSRDAVWFFFLIVSLSFYTNRLRVRRLITDRVWFLLRCRGSYLSTWRWSMASVEKLSSSLRTGTRRLTKLINRENIIELMSRKK